MAVSAAYAEGIEDLHERVREDREQAVRAALELDEQLRAPGLTLDERARLEGQMEFAYSRIDQLERRRQALPEIRVTREPDIYQRGDKRRSFFADLVASANPSWPVPGVSSATEASERLQRHTDFERGRVELTEADARAGLPFYGITASPQSRALSSTAGAGGELVPPRWMQEQWASVARAACPLKQLVTRVDLPPDTLLLEIPRFDSAAGVVPDAVENTTAPDQYSSTDSITAKVATFEGSALVSQQLYDRGGQFSDEIVLQDFADAYGQSLAQQLMNGTGTNGQMLGLLNVGTSVVDGVPGAILTTYTAATPTSAGIVNAIAQCAGTISDTRKRSPTVILMRGSRWFSIAGAPDGSGNEPTQRPGTGTVPKTDTGPYGPLASLPVYHDNEIPSDLGAGTNQDAIVLVRASDVILLEDPVGPRFVAYPGSDSAGQLAVVLGWHMYAAVFPQRYPSAIGSVQGTGLVVPAGF